MVRLHLASSLAALAWLSSACVGGRDNDPAGAPAGAVPAMMGPPPKVLSDDGVFPVASENETRPRLRYMDGQVSLNDTCAVRLGNKLNPKIPPMYVNGQPIGFC